MSGWQGIFQGGDFRSLRAGMEANWRTSMEVNHNLANAETPDFSARQTDFKSVLLDQPGQPAKGEAFELYMEDLRGPEPFNLEGELARMSRSGLENEAVAKVLQKRYADLRYVIREGR